MTAAPAAVVVEADGGSRGNPGNAAYGAVLKEATTGRVLAERAERIGVASNNVAEYRGLIAGLELYREHADGAELEVRMDSKLVVEQMSGRWKIKHPSMRPLALEANRIAPPGTRYTWIPREQNAHADRLANLALDGPEGVVHGGASPAAPPEADADPSPSVTLLLVRGGSEREVRATADWLAAGLSGPARVLVGSPESADLAAADLVGRRLGTTPSVDAALGGSTTAASLRDRLLTAYPGEVVVAVAGHDVVTSLTALALGLPARAPLRAELAPASVTVLTWSAAGAGVGLLGGLPSLQVPQPIPSVGRA